MLNFRISISIAALALAAALGAEEPKMPASPGFDPQACVKHCQEMAAAHQKMMDSHKAMMEKHQAAWKDIQAQLDVARKSRGEKKVAALETVVERLVALHDSMQQQMGDCPMMGAPMMRSGMMGCCGEGMMGMEMGMDMGMDCPMGKKMTAGPEAPGKPAH